MDTHTPTVFKLKSNNVDIGESNIITSSRINEQLMSLGFHHYINRSKSYLDITKTLETDKEFYYVVNPYEINIDNNDNDLYNLTKKEYGIDTTSINFYKFWEMFSLFDLMKKSDMVVATMGAHTSQPGGVIEAFLTYRKKYSNVGKNKIYDISIKGEGEDIDKQFLGKYKGVLDIHKTYTKATAKKYAGKDTGDIRELKTISNFKKTVDKSGLCDLVIGNGELMWKNWLYQEQESYMLLLGEIIAALRVQNKGGNFILRIFDTMTTITVKYLYILSSLYEEVYIYKPFTSRYSYSEKYVICKKFKHSQDKGLDIIVKSLEDVLTKMETKEYVNDIFTSMDINEEFINFIKYINIHCINKQQIMINNIVSFIKSNNYFGDEYHQYKEKQIDASQFWSDIFIKQKKTDMIDKNIKYNDGEFKLFIEKFV